MVDISKLYSKIGDVVTKIYTNNSNKIANEEDCAFQYCHLRAEYTELLSSLQDKVLPLRELWCRVFWDCCLAGAFSAANLDWYGRQWGAAQFQRNFVS